MKKRLLTQLMHHGSQYKTSPTTMTAMTSTEKTAMRGIMKRKFQLEAMHA